MSSNIIQIKIKYFASLRELMEKSEELVSCNSEESIGTLWHNIAQGKNIVADVLMTKNMCYVNENTKLDDGDEVAFFPPVTGG